MVRSFRILIAVVFAALILSGCDDTTQLIDQISSLQQQLSQCQQQASAYQSDLATDKDAKQTLVAQISRQAAFAQACAWGIQICPDSIAQPSQFSVKIGSQSFPIEPNPWLFDTLLTLKFGALALVAASFLIALWRLYLWAIKPEKHDIAAARSDIESAKDRVQDAKQEEQRIKTRAANLKAQLESEIDNLQDEASALTEQRDALVGEVEDLQARKLQAQSATDLLDAAFKPKKK